MVSASTQAFAGCSPRVKPGAGRSSGRTPSGGQRSREPDIAAVFGSRVRKVRTARKLTKEALAEAAGLHPSLVSNIERGNRVPTVATLLRLAEGLSVPPSALVDDLVE